ncbi:MAG TPA: septum site-determining protein MinC [Cyanobacteria bacterium UBA8530]|nr:septum site-determining protein MinC [Cyanobacteria bacterium UBA8530]
MTIAIKGTRNGLTIVIPDEEAWEQVLSQLQAKFGEQESFWSGAAVLELGERELEEEDLKKAIALLEEAKLGPFHLVALHPKTIETGARIGLCPPSAPEKLPTGNALYLKGTIRSGQVVRHDGSIVICGDVNAGAEVIAGGDVVVFGTLRGMAHAGAEGNEKAQVVAVNLRPTQIRIAGKIARSPDHGAPPLSKSPEVASIVGGDINISPLS